METQHIVTTTDYKGRIVDLYKTPHEALAIAWRRTLLEEIKKRGIPVQNQFPIVREFSQPRSN